MYSVNFDISGQVAVITGDDLHNEVRTVKLNGYENGVFTGFIV